MGCKLFHPPHRPAKSRLQPQCNQRPFPGQATAIPNQCTIDRNAPNRSLKMKSVSAARFLHPRFPSVQSIPAVSSRIPLSCTHHKPRKIKRKWRDFRVFGVLRGVVLTKRIPSVTLFCQRPYPAESASVFVSDEKNTLSDVKFGIKNFKKIRTLPTGNARALFFPFMPRTQPARYART